MRRSQDFQRYDEARSDRRSRDDQHPGRSRDGGSRSEPAASSPGAYGRSRWDERDWDEDRYGYPEATSYPREMNRGRHGYGVEGRFAQYDRPYEQDFDEGFDGWRSERGRLFEGGGSSSGRGAESGNRQQARGRWQDRPGPKGYTRSDERVRDEVCERLTRSDDIDLREVSVEVREGVLSLAGSVPDRQMKHRIEDICDDCYGVREIDNRLRVSRPSSADARHGEQDPGRGAETPDRPSAIWAGESNAQGSVGNSVVGETGNSTRQRRGGH